MLSGRAIRFAFGTGDLGGSAEISVSEKSPGAEMSAGRGGLRKRWGMRYCPGEGTEAESRGVSAAMGTARGRVRGVRATGDVADPGQDDAVGGGPQPRDGAEPGVALQRMQSGAGVGEGQPAAAAGVAGVSAPVASAGGLTLRQQREYRRLVRAARHRGPDTAVTADETVEILERYHGLGQTQAAIGHTMEVSQQVVSDVVRRYRTSAVLAKWFLQAQSVEMAERFVKEAAPKELLQALSRIKTPAGERILEAARDAEPVVTAPAVVLGVKFTLNAGD